MGLMGRMDPIGAKAIEANGAFCSKSECKVNTFFGVFQMPTWFFRAFGIEKAAENQRLKLGGIFFGG